MLSDSRIPLSAEEHAAVERLLAKHPDVQASLTRRDPGETGPVQVHIGDEIWHVDADGKTKKARR